VRTGRITYGLSKGNGNEERKDSKGLHDGNGKGREGRGGGERATEFVGI
jgi:hypothetical protein